MHIRYYSRFLQWLKKKGVRFKGVFACNIFTFHSFWMSWCVFLSCANWVPLFIFLCFIQFFKKYFTLKQNIDPFILIYRNHFSNWSHRDLEIVFLLFTFILVRSGFSITNYVVMNFKYNFSMKDVFLMSLEPLLLLLLLHFGMGRVLGKMHLHHVVVH